jgi:hypothetical protein
MRADCFEDLTIINVDEQLLQEFDSSEALDHWYFSAKKYAWLQVAVINSTGSADNSAWSKIYRNVTVV